MTEIYSYKEIISENPNAQVWKLLRKFLDPTHTSKTIRNIHGLSEKEQSKNVSKQATQIGYCIRQAQEYFRASSQVGLPTRPLLLYYGAASLSSALFLLKQTGDCSLDTLRNQNKHLHHGLEFQRGLPSKDYLARGVEQFFSSIICSCHIKKNSPWGLFGLFYQSLAPCSFAFEIEVHDAGKQTYMTGHDTLKCTDMLELDTIKNKKFIMLDVIKYLPDMYFTLNDMRIQTYICRGSVRRNITRYYNKDTDGKEQVERTREATDFFIDDINEADKKYLTSFYSNKNPDIKVIADLGRSMHLNYTIEYKAGEEVFGYLPDAGDAITGAIFYILKPETYLHEPAAFLMLLFCLGMLSRYYPDLWIYTIDKNVEIAEFTDSLLNIIYRKFPNLILDQMTSTKHHVHI